MKNNSKNILLLISTILFYAFFWQEKMGLNNLLFSCAMIGILSVLHPESLIRRQVQITLVGSLVTAGLIVWNNSGMSKTMHFISMTAMVGFVKQKELRFLGYGFLLYLISFFETPGRIAKSFQTNNPQQSIRLAPVWRSFRISVVPLLVLMVFYSIYHVANPAFRAASNNFWAYIGQWLTFDISVNQVLFFIAGFLIITPFIAQTAFSLFRNLENKHTEALTRTRPSNNRLRFLKGMIGLKSEFQSGLILLILLNVLLLIVNSLDIKNYWFGNSYILPPYEMKLMVHQGTYLLITALLLAMIVIGYFFRKNLNFFPDNKKLKAIGYFWIAQNVILAISLFIKNYRYIEANDLAYKRIGVLIFLVLVFTGLLTMFLKIRDRKTFYFLLHRNAWIAYIFLIVCSFIPWDHFITDYNLRRADKTKIDYHFLIHTVSDKNLYQLSAFNESEQMPIAHYNLHKRKLEAKAKRFISKQENYSWLSWNYPDYINKSYLESISH